MKNFGVIDILSAEKPSSILYALYDAGTLKEFLPELTDLYIDQKGHKNNFVHTLRVLDNACDVSQDVWFRLAALLHDIGKGPTRKFVDGEWTFRYHEDVGAQMLPTIWIRLNLPEGKLAYVSLITKYHGLAKELCKENVSDSAVRRFYKDTKEHFDDLIAFCKCDITTRFPEKKAKQVQELVDLYSRAKKIEADDIAAAYRIPIDGVWLMEVTGKKPGKWIQEVKSEVEAKIKSGLIVDEEGPAKTLALEILKSKNLL